MDYASFLALRERGWREFEERLAQAQEHPRAVGYEDLEFLAVRYRQILHDSGLAGARFPGTGAERRLARLAVVATRFLHQEPAASGHPLLRFWSATFPRAFRGNLPNLALAVFLFFVGAVFGLGLAAMQLSLAVTLLGARSVEGLANGHLWTESLVSSVPPTVSSSAIARNNLGVALAGWAGGALAGIGSLYILFLNGFLLGAVFGVTLHYSMAGRLLEFVSAHGVLEITLILVTASAGLRMGRAVVEATDLPRRDVLRAAGSDALVILFGCLPWFVPLGVVEGFLSPSPELAPAAKAALGIGLCALFLTIAWNPFLKEEKR
ncbi:MAG TPA: stage II sporulation protein M [Thermoanaerobaculia bacterium]|nr:stage II sporulation protein M [Thermoanaerobaculia bacterium]